MTQWYKEDLAYIHDVGFSEFALKSAPGILEILQQNLIQTGLIVELGCGSGLLTQELVKANYQVLGIDISPEMIAIARQRLPNIEFRLESLFKADIPPCQAVISVGECFNYLFDTDNNSALLVNLFRRIYNALTPGGVLIFDLVEMEKILLETPRQKFTEGNNWLVLVERQEDQQEKILTRRIITFRKVGEHYRRDEETHRQRLYESEEIAFLLRQEGFQVERKVRYGLYNLPKNHSVFIARKAV
ncbi:class I SAM-dependent methyltransferase [Gloeothece verrucosa]|uniref:Methyltransferase type 11 n=1 Tax=Gloeothece verrucosa (strain PCC 7822) TaxID=497965 RepID=E0U8E8_GLOV7|nr:class I SAM-dependent methyltransferase [Gloeothece verrucosa]ADN12584.1 Methyltransferase type 11 [Gloeothece verrucosa PCC 7822]